MCQAWDPDLDQGFLLEARAAAGPFHPHIVTISELWEEQGQLYIAVHYRPGPSPAGLIAEKEVKT